MGNCMVIRRSFFQKKKGKPVTEAVPNGQSSRSMSSSNRAISTTTTRSHDHIIIGNNLEVREKRITNDNQDAKNGAARVMRIRVVVTQSQLSQIMKESKNSAYLSSSSAAVKQMLLTSTIKVSSTGNSVSRSTQNDQGGSMNGKWRPRLQSISEE